MKTIRAVIIDDEQDSVDLLSLQLKKYCTEIVVIKVFNNPVKALDEIELLNPDLIFLDVEMPEMNGFRFLEKLIPIHFNVVFITAYSEFAIKAFRFSALDYLVKPIEPIELIQAVKKASEQHKISMQQLDLIKGQQTLDKVDKIAVMSLNEVVFLNLNDILYIEASSNYSIIILDNGDNVVISKTLKDVHEILEQRNFFRIHRQYIINLHKVKHFHKSDCVVTLINGKQLQVARIQKDKLIDKFDLV